MECGAMHFGEFNPLDVLATAASLQSSGRGEGEETGQSDGDGETEEGGEDGAGEDTGSKTLTSPVTTSETVTSPLTSASVTSPHISQTVTSPASSETITSPNTAQPSPSKSTQDTDTGKPVEKTSESVIAGKTSFVSPNGTVKPSPVSLQPLNKNHRNNMPRVVKVVNANMAGPSNKVANANGRPLVSLRDNTKVMVACKEGTPKSVTVLRLNKNPDHSYAVYSKMDKPRFEEDEGYCSRSSLGSPGQCWKSDSETTEPDVFESRETVDCDPKSPYLVLPSGGSSVKAPDHLSPTISSIQKAGQLSVHSPPSTSKTVLSPPVPSKSGVTVLDGPPVALETITPSKSAGASKKQTKIVIVSRDANLRKFFAHSKDTETKPTDTETIQSLDSCHEKESDSRKMEDVVVDDLPDDKQTHDVVSEDVVELSPTTGVLSIVSKSTKASQKQIELDCKGNSCLTEANKSHITTEDKQKQHPDASNDSPDVLNSPPGTPEPPCAMVTPPVNNPGHDQDCLTTTDTILVPIEPPALSTAGACKQVLHISKELCTVGSEGMIVDPQGQETTEDSSVQVNMDTVTDTTGCSETSPDCIDCSSQALPQSPQNTSAQVSLDIEGVDMHQCTHDVSLSKEEEVITQEEDDAASKTPVVVSGSKGGNHCVLAEITDNSSCVNTANNEARENSVIHSPNSTADVLTVVTPGEHKETSHKMLQGLLAAGKAKVTESMKTQTVLLPSGQICKLNTSIEGQANLQPLLPGIKPVVSSTGAGVNKTGVVYLVSTNQASGSVSVADQSIPSKVTSSSTPGSRYIIQDDLPPVAKYNPGSLSASQTKSVVTSLAKTNVNHSSGGRLSAGQPKAMAPAKDSWVVLKPAPSTPTANLVAMAPTIRGIVPGGCTMLPLLVGTSGSKPKSLLPIAAKAPSSSPSALPVSRTLSLQAQEQEVLSTSSKSLLDKTSVLNNKKIVPSSSSVIATASASIPNMTVTPIDSSQLLSPSVNSSVLPDEIFAAPTVDMIKPSSTAEDSSLASPVKPSDVTAATSSVSPMEQDQEVSAQPSSEGTEDGSEASHVSPCATPVTPASGRTTPAYEGRLTPLDFTSSSSDSSPSPSGGKINIKISGGVVVDVRQENTPREAVSKATRSIGQVGSLTWQGTLSSSRAVGVIKGASSTLPTSRIKTTKTHKKEMSALELRRKQRAKLKAGNPSRAELFRMRESAQSMSELHPLIDHDYCTFTEFSADIQSSIIATTESKLKTERKYIKKAKAARTKSTEDSPAKCIVDIPKLKKRKYTKRKLGQLLQSVQKETLISDTSVETTAAEERPISSINQLPMMSLENKKLRNHDRKPKRRYRPRNSGDKNYVKIPGSYQDQFVYYATKKVRGRPRKYQSELGDPGIGLYSQTTKPTAATNISEFEWYKEMARIDKGSKFGVTNMGIDDTLKPPSSLPLPRNGSQSVPYPSNKGTTPIHESEVVDMVMDMMPSSDIPVSTAVDSNKILNGLMQDTDSQMSVSSLPGTSVGKDLGPAHSEDSSSSSLRTGSMITETVETVPPPEEGTVDAGVMAEFHRLLNSMEESDQLKILENLNVDSRVANTDEEKGETKAAVDIKADRDGTLNNLNAYLGAYNSESQSSGAPQPPSSSQFLDLDEINDSDLLNTELGNIGAIFGDLATSSSNTTSMVHPGIMATSVLDSPTKMPSSHFSSFAENSCSDTYSIESSNMDISGTLPVIPASRENSGSSGGALSGFGRPLDEAELFPDISSPSVSVPPVTDFGGVPELMLVNMYWNDLPGLLIQGQEYVRLVDIHKQVLPAKDTGILKKRCQMMGLDIRNCSELQRDFLIRYMNAAKSKSCVIVQKEAAKTLIGFYVDPRPRTINKQTSEEVASPTQPWRDEDASSVEMETAGQEQAADVVLSEEEADSQKPSSTGKSKQWTMHDHDHPKHNGLKVVSTSDTPKVVKIRIPKPSNRLISKQRAAPGGATASGNTAAHPEIDPKRSARLKNKKVQYAALHNGSWGGEGEDVDMDGVVDDHKLSKVSVPPVVVEAPTVTIPAGEATQEPGSSVNILPSTDSGEIKIIFAAPKTRKISSADDIELKKLITKQKKRKLNQKEKRRIRRLREKIRKQEARISQEDMKRLKERREKWLKNLEKAKQKRLLEKTQAAKYSREHCYAAYPEQTNAVNEENSTDTQDTASSNTPGPLLDKDCGPVVCDLLLDGAVQDASSPVSNMVQSGTSDIQENKSGSVEQSAPAENPRPQDPSPPDLSDKTLPVVHRDTVQRGQRGRTQDGTLHLGRYHTKEAACIQCNTCQEKLSVRRFLKHRHPQNIADELMEVSLPQRLELGLDRYPSGLPPLTDLALYAVFLHKRQQFTTNPGPSQRSRSRKPPIKRGAEETSAVSVNKPPKTVKITPATNSQRSPVQKENKSEKSEKRTNKPKNKVIRRTESQKEAASPLPFLEEDLSPGGSVRHSSRNRKKKQLHPMESYVFARRLSQGEPEVKKAKRSGRRGHAKSLG